MFGDRITPELKLAPSAKGEGRRSAFLNPGALMRTLIKAVKMPEVAQYQTG